MVYFVQGILGLSRLAVSFYCKDDLALDPATVASLTTLGAIPWFIKPLYGFISDSLPLFGYHRRSYLVLAGLLGFSGWTALAWAVDSPGGLVAVLLITALGTASSDVVVDSLVVERARGHPQEIAGSLQSLCWSSAAVGGVLSAYWSGALVEHYGTRFVFGLTALFPLIVSFSALLINEQRVTYSGGRPMGPPRGAPSASAAENGWGGGQGEEESSRLLSQSDKDTAADTGAPQAAVQLSEAGLGQQLLGRARLLWGALKGRGVFMPTVFIFVWNATPSYSDAMFFFTTNELGFEPEFLGRVRLVSSLASLGGVLLYNTLLKQTPIRTLLWYAMLLGVALGSTQLLLVSGLNRQLGLSDQLFALGDTALLTALSQASTMPILVLAARLCPEGVEATLFATLMSVFNLGSHAGELLGAGLTKALGITSNNFNHLFTLVVICNIAQLLPAPLLRFIPDALTGVEAEEAAAKEARREQGREDGEGNDDDDNDEFGPPGGGESSAPGTTATSVVLVADHGPQARGDGAVVSADVELLPRRSHKPAWQVGLHDVASSPQRRLKLG